MEAFLSSFSSSSALDEPFSQLRDIPQLPHLRIAPLRDPIPPRSGKAPSPLEPNAGAVKESKYAAKTNLTSGNLPTEPPSLAGFLNTPRTDKTGPVPSPTDPVAHAEFSSKTVLPAFINLRAVERLPYSSFDEEIPRKRRQLDSHSDSFSDHLQLPIPKNQKETPKPPPFGPLTILNGLNEPPPNAALFPPIEPEGTHTILTRPRRDTPNPSEHDPLNWKKGRRERKVKEIIDPEGDGVGNLTVHSDEDLESKNPFREGKVYEPRQIDDGSDGKRNKPSISKSQPKKKLRKWSDQETHDLLQGVVRCGVGNWTAILAQPDLNFNNRTASNLKDRFRVCCPWAYESNNRPSSESVHARLADSVNNAQPGKIFLPDPRKKGIGESNPIPTSASNLSSLKAVPNTTIAASAPFTTQTTDSLANIDTAPQPKPKPRRRNSPSSKRTQTLSNKSKSTLISLGLTDPDVTVKANRRSRRPFTAAEDEALLKGYAVHGFQWTLIRQDKHLNLMHRKATDLRDRFRTKFPSAYREGGSATAKNIPGIVNPSEPSSSSSTLPPGKSQGETNSKTLRAGDQPHQSEGASSSAGQNHISTTSICMQRTDIPIGSTNATPVDPAMLPPAPPSNTAFPFSMMDESVATGGGENSDLRWADNNTLPPLIWEEL